MINPENLQVKKRYYTRIMDVYRKQGIYIPCLPTLIRTALRLRIAKDHLKSHTFYRTNEREVREWFETRHIFFGFGVIRSGTAFLANFLNQVVQDAVIEHEAFVGDYWYYHRALQSESEAEKYIGGFRLTEIFSRMRHRPENRYGEINPFLRRRCRALQKYLPKAKFFHLVRDGRKVVRSIMSRQTFDRTDPLGCLVRPPSNDPYAGVWKKMSRFEKVCWLWQCDNRYLRESIGFTLSFEKLIRDWDYFKRGTAGPYRASSFSGGLGENYSRRVGNPTPVFRMGSGHPGVVWKEKGL